MLNSAWASLFEGNIMPDKDGFPTADEIINGPKRSLPEQQATNVPDGMLLALITKHMAQTISHVPLTAEQTKAVSIIISGLPYIIVGMRPTNDGTADGEATGCDFITALDGDKEVIRATAQHLDGVVQRLLQRNGIM